jgi:hypothetical protein
MKRILAAGLLALLGLGVLHTTASADCFHVYKPCYKFPVPPIPIFCPSFKFFCEACNHGCGCPSPGGHWYAQFPNQGAPMGYTIAPYGAFSGSVYGGGYGSYGQPAHAWSGYGQGYAAPAMNPGYAAPAQVPAWNGYGGQYVAQPYYWRQ